MSSILLSNSCTISLRYICNNCIAFPKGAKQIILLKSSEEIMEYNTIPYLATCGLVGIQKTTQIDRLNLRQSHSQLKRSVEKVQYIHSQENFSVFKKRRKRSLECLNPI